MSCIPRFVLLIALLLLPIAAEAQGLFVDVPSTREMSDSARPAVAGTVKRTRVAMIDAEYLARNVMPDISMAAGQKLAAKLLPVLLPLFPDIVLNLDGEQVEASVDGGGSPGAYNYGYVDTTARIRTVMAYNDKCAAQGFTCTRIPFFSSPYLSYSGVALGVNPWSSQAAYNVRRLTETRSAVSAFRNGTVAAPTPASGWWWNASEAGRGYSIEIQGNALFFAAYSYAADGTALWYVSSGQMGDNKTSYVGDLQQYSGGQTLNGSYKPATVLGSAGKLQIYFDSETTGYLVFPGGSGTSISRFDFITNGSVGGPAPGYPQTGWWWNANEAGRGYFVEAQNTSMFVSFYMYNASGQAVWYIASGVMTSANVFQGTLQEYSGGSTLTSAFRAPNGTNSIGAVTIQFASGTAAVLTLPNGAQVSLSRFTF